MANTEQNAQEEEKRKIRIHQIHERIAALNEQRAHINQEIDDMSKELEKLRAPVRT